MDNNLIYLSRPDFRKYLSENMVSTREFTFHMEKAGIKVKESKKRMGTGWKDANGSVTVMAYAFSLDKFQDIIEKIDEAKQ
jgi:hypothetical protein